MRARPAGPAESSALHDFARSGPTKEAHRRALYRSGGLQRSVAGQAPSARRATQRNDRPSPPHSKHSQKYPLTCGLEPEEGFEPSTFRLRVETHPSSRFYPERFWLLVSAGSSVEYVPDAPCYGRGNDQAAQGVARSGAAARGGDEMGRSRDGRQGPTRQSRSARRPRRSATRAARRPVGTSLDWSSPCLQPRGGAFLAPPRVIAG
jgi:hypothetical protein